MKLRNARVALSATEAASMDLTVARGRVWFEADGQGPEVDLSGYLVLPGLINAHDHLEFNLFPRLGQGPYANATAWARDIYKPAESPVREQLEVPKAERLRWGGLKNLIAGVTSVLHHNPYVEDVFECGFAVRVIRRFGWSHSLAFSKDVAADYAATPEGAPFLIHAGEGTDDVAAGEIAWLDTEGLLGSRTVVVHGVALGRDEVRLMEARGASLVWCPTSNAFTLGRTITREVLRSKVPIALGTDSAMTAEGDLVDEMRVAAREVGARRVYEMVTSDAARILGLTAGEGSISDGGLADLLVVKDCGAEPAAALPEVCPEMVLVGGEVRLVSEEFTGRAPAEWTSRLQPLAVEGRGRWHVGCEVPLLRQDLRLAGKAVSS